MALTTENGKLCKSSHEITTDTGRPRRVITTGSRKDESISAPNWFCASREDMVIMVKPLDSVCNSYYDCYQTHPGWRVWCACELPGFQSHPGAHYLRIPQKKTGAEAPVAEVRID
jgi:hypothetical protein